MFRHLITAVLGLAVFSALADTNNTKSQYNPTTGQTVPAVVILQSSDGLTAKPIDASNPLPVTATVTPSGTQNVNITQVGGNAVTTSVPVSNIAPTDAYPTGGTITTQDIASTTVQGQFNQNQTTGTPTASSTVSFAVAGYTTFSFGITGTWTGTQTVEASAAPAGVTPSTIWTNKTCRVPGSTLSASTFTSNASDLICNIAGYTNVRIRATAAMTGTATIGAVAASVNLHAIDLINPAKLVDGAGTNNTLTIKAASTAPLATDTAAVVSISPNTPTLPVSAAALPLPTGAATSANQATNAAQASTTSGQTGNLEMTAVTTALPTYSNGTTQPLTTDTSGRVRTLTGGVISPGSGTSGSLPVLIGLNDTGAVIRMIAGDTLGHLLVAAIPGGTAVGATATGATTSNLTATIAAVASKTNYLTAASVTCQGLVAAVSTTITVTGLVGGTRTYQFPEPIIATPLPIPTPFGGSAASAANTAIAVQINAIASGATCSINLDGQQF